MNSTKFQVHYYYFFYRCIIIIFFMKLIIVKILPIMQDSIVSTLHFILNYLKSISTLYLTFFPISDNKARSCRFSLQTRLSYRGRTSSIYLKRCSALKEYKLLETSFQKKMWSCKEAVKHIEFFCLFLSNWCLEQVFWKFHKKTDRNYRASGHPYFIKYR